MLVVFVGCLLSRVFKVRDGHEPVKFVSHVKRGSRVSGFTLSGRVTNCATSEEVAGLDERSGPSLL